MCTKMRREFEVHKLNEAGIEAAEELAQDFENFLELIESSLGDDEPRLLAIVRTKLEEACFFAKKALASKPEFQKAS